MTPHGTVPARLGGRVDAMEPLRHNEGNAATGGIWRARGPAGTAVVKVARPPSPQPTGSPVWQTSDEPTHWNYWRREVLAYTTGLAGRAYADAGIVAPELLAAPELPDGAVELWLADATGAAGTSWPVPRLARFARQLGVAQARWVDRVPDLPWLSRRWLRQYLAEGPARRVTDGDDRNWDHPAAAPWPEWARRELRRLWTRRDSVLAAAEATPRTLCHLDLWPNNLIAAGDDGSVLVDWSFTGEGGLGEDVANLIVDSVADGLMDAALLPQITVEVTDGYLAGLRDGGCRVDPDAVRRAIAVCGAAKYCWLGPAVLRRVVAGGTVGHPQYGQDRSGAEAVHRLTGVVTLLAEWAAVAG